MRKTRSTILNCMLLTVCALIPIDVCAAAGSARITVVCGQRDLYKSAAVTLIESLKANGHACELIEWPKASDKPSRKQALARIADSKPNIVVASGASATSQVLTHVPNTPVVFYMVPNALDASFMAPKVSGHARTAGVAANISASERLRWVKKLDANAKRVGILYSRRTKKTMKSFQEAARSFGIEIVAIETSRDRIPEAIESLTNQHVDGVLMIPDAAIYNSASVQRLLLWGARQKKPVWSFSEGIVKAGALAGQFANGEAVGRQTADLVEKILEGTPPKQLGIQYPNRIDSAVNTHTAGIIGITLSNTVLSSGVVRYGDQQ